MAGGSRGRGRRSGNGAGTSRSAYIEQLNDGATRVDWGVPDTTEEWAQFGMTAYDEPITPQEWEQFHNAREAYYTAHGGQSPPRYQSNQGLGLPMSQVLPARLKNSCDEANAEIQDIGRKWRHNMDLQKQKEDIIAEQKELLEMMKRDVREKQKEIKRLEDEVIEIKDSYTGMEELMKEKAGWIRRVREIYP